MGAAAADRIPTLAGLFQACGTAFHLSLDLKQDGIEFPGAQVFGSSANMVDIEDKTIEFGRFISNEDVQRSALVVVLGAGVKEELQRAFICLSLEPPTSRSTS